jgi:hypothetical protein
LKKTTLKPQTQSWASRTKISGLLLICALAANAQMRNSGPMYIGDNATLHVVGNVYFDAPAQTATSRGSAHGKLSFGASASQSGASASHYIDGYARALNTTAFTFPIGQAGKYAPARVTSAAATTVEAAFYDASPTTLGSTVSNTLNAIATTEYWEISGTSTLSVSLSWSAASNVTALTGGNLAKLALAGWDGAQWVEVPATVDATSFLGGTSDLTSGSITANSPVDLNIYTAFALASKTACEALVASSGNTKTWNGSWTPSAPTLADPVVIDAPYSGNLDCNSLVLNANLTLSDGQYIDVVNGVTGTGTVVMSSQASVVQRNPAASAPTIQLTKLSRPMRRFDYIFLSNPTNSPTTFYNQMMNKNNVAVAGQFGVYPAGGFSGFKTIDATGNTQISITTLSVGKGFRALVRNQTPYATTNTAGSWDNDRRIMHMKAEGTANNGDVAINVPASSWAFIGNPYPSAIDGGKLLDEAGSNVVKTLWYWTYEHPMTSAFTYTSSDFATWTQAGGVTTCGTCPTPDGSIASMQGVYIKGAGLSGSATDFNISNCMRITDGNDTFFRQSTAEKDRFWLNMEGTSGSFNQILIAYLPGATLTEDNGLDGQRMIFGNNSRFSSLIGTTEYAIQARPEFHDTDAVPVAVNRANNESFTISLGNTEGIFNAGQKIFLHDTALGIYHDLANGGYNYLPVTDYDTNRFEVVYRDAALGTNQFQVSYAVAAINNSTFSAVAALKMTHIEIFDLQGRLITQYEANGETSIVKPFHHAEGIYVAKIKLDNGTYATQKLIHKE